MNYKHFLLAAIGGMFLLAGCDQKPELPVDSSNQYVAFNIVAPTAANTKGTEGGSDNGTAEESAVKSVYFFFYKNGTYIAEGKNISEGTFQFDANGSSQAVVVLESDGTKPNQVLCVINSERHSAIKGKTLDDVVALLQNESHQSNAFGVRTDPAKLYFAMINSPYIDNGQPVYGYPIGDHIKATAADAQSNPVEVNVERIVSKVSVDASGLTNTLSAQYEIAFKGWALNGVNRDSYIIKNINPAWASSTYSPDWDEAWMYHAGQKRTCWAEDPNYSTATHQMKTNYAITNYRYDDAANPLQHFTMKQLWDHANATGYTDDAVRKVYCFENTFNPSLTVNYRNVSTHVIVICQFKPAGAASYANLYRYNGNIYTEDAYKGQALTDALNSLGYTFYVGADAASAVALTKDHLDIVRAIVDNGVIKSASGEKTDAHVSVFPTNLGAGNQLFVSTDGGTTKTVATDVQISKAFGEYVVERAELFQNGWMYYVVPIEHLNNATPGDPKVVYEGKYGMVRNHFYQVTLGQITGIGNGCYDPADPNYHSEEIVPDDKNDIWYLAARININAWHVVTQTSNLVD